MKRMFVRSLLALLTIASLPILADAQSTSVTLQVTDAGSQSWNNGTWTVVLKSQVGATNFGPPFNLVGGGTVPNQTQSGALSGTGGASMTLTPNASVLPSLSGWQFSVCPQQGIPAQCFVQTFTVSGASQTVTIVPPTISVNCGSGVNAYADSEVSCSIGGQYYNVTTPSQRQCTASTGTNCTSWAAAGGGGITSVASLPGTCTIGAGFILPDNSTFTCGAGNTYVPTPGRFFAKYQGISPTDPPFNAAWDWQIRTDCAVTSPAATATCATSTPFKSTDCQTGTGCTGTRNAIFEFVGAGAAGAVLTGTITSFISSSVVGLSVASGTTVTNSPFKWGTNDTTPINAWVAAINAKGSVHSGWLPSGMGYTTHLNPFVALVSGGPTGANTDCNGWIVTTPNSGVNCSLVIQGPGNTQAGIYVATAGQYTWTPNANNNCGVVLVQNWSSYLLQGFTVLADNSVHAVGTCSNMQGLVVMDTDSHGYMANVWTEGLHNTSNSACGTCTAQDFESFIQPYTEGDDVPLLACGGNAVGTCEKMTYANGFSEGGITRIGSQIGGGNVAIQQVRFENMHAQSALQILNAHTVNNDSIVISNSRINESGAISAFLINNTFTGNVDITNTYLEILNNNPAILIGGTGVNLRWTQGAINNPNVACTLGCLISQNSGSFTYLNQVLLNSNLNTDASYFSGTVTNISNFQTVTSPFVGLGGRGSLTASNYLTFGNCASSGGTCGSSAAGAVSIAAAATTVTVATTAVTANSQILITEDSTLGTRLSVTCNTTTGRTYSVTTRTAGTSFVITASAAPAANPACLNYTIVN
jgi:hypothetical protein